MVVGSTCEIDTAYMPTNADAYLLRLDADGDTLWTKACGGSGSDLANDGRQTSDGGYILVGWTNSYGSGNQDVYVAKTDANGDTVWTRSFGRGSHDFGYSVIEALDGGAWPRAIHTRRARTVGMST